MESHFSSQLESFILAAFWSNHTFSNWKSLGDSSKARSSLIWTGITALLLFLNIFVEGNLNIVFFIMLIAWYFTSAKAQMHHVKLSFPDYVHKRWGKPLLIGLAGIVLYACIITGVVTYVGSDLPRVDDSKVISIVEQILTDSPQGKFAGLLLGKMAIEMPAETKYDRNAHKRYARAMLKAESKGVSREGESEEKP